MYRQQTTYQKEIATLQAIGHAKAAKTKSFTLRMNGTVLGATSFDPTKSFINAIE